MRRSAIRSAIWEADEDEREQRFSVLLVSVLLVIEQDVQVVKRVQVQELRFVEWEEPNSGTARSDSASHVVSRMAPGLATVAPA